MKVVALHNDSSLGLIILLEAFEISASVTELGSAGANRSRRIAGPTMLRKVGTCLPSLTEFAAKRSWTRSNG